ncbi:MAG TPA: protein-disulfide reductase DsbD domain-containing protein [Rhizomicrobium sp.]|nr:protein-disulfide reductase DsbD domain-containing protein [Rhizomicrobium sp.]
MLRIFFCVLFVLAGATAAGAQIDSVPKVHVRLVAEQNEVAPAKAVTVALVEHIRPGWHTYWQNPGDAGQPTEIQWTMPPGWHAGSIQWPWPKELPVGPLMDYGYEGDPWLLVNVTPPANATPGDRITLKAHATWLVCKEVCIPEDATVTLPLAIAAKPQPANPATAAAFAAARARLPTQSPWPARFASGDALGLVLAAPNLANANVTAAHFFPLAQGEVKGIAPQQWRVSQQGLLLRLQPGKGTKSLRALNGLLEIESAGAPTQALEISALPGPVPDFGSDVQLSLAPALLFAFLGGLILNLMPCVLPILAMKALALASHSGRETREARHEGFAYGAGAVLSFAVLGAAVLALRAAGEAIGWGFQLQEPAVVAAFALLVFAIGLNLSGVFEVPGIGAGDVLARRGGTAGAFFTGVLAVAVAAPCTAPFMAAALGYALTQPAAAALLVFVALGIGFSAPFVAVGLSPALRRLLPKPGAWMNVFRQLLAFPMYATGLWLLWVLALESDPDHVAMVLGAALVLAFALWLLGTARQSTRASIRKGIQWPAGVLAVAMFAAPAVLLGARHDAAPLRITAIPSQPYSERRLVALRGQKRGVFVDATAAWCLTCLVNEKVALDRPAVRQAFEKQRIALLVADWTNRNPEVTQLLQAHSRSGVPLYLYYAPGAADAVVLPQILTPEAVLQAIGRS